MSEALKQINAAFAKRGHETYGEGVSQLEHALQCAHFAQRDGASDAQVIAAYLHDIGHLIHEFPADIADRGIDTEHESLGSIWLSQFFAAPVTEPILLHVAAKRYLAAVEPGYFEKLSDASKLSLRLQGGPMNPSQVADFEANPFFKEAVALRRWDEEGKIVGFKGPVMADFEPLLESLVLKH
jgi:[1-hydroxy-2-(trimethylamino)ethyl]phosphonate dioxygenase